MFKEENLFKKEPLSAEVTSFGLSDKLIGAANVPAAEVLVGRLEEENNNLEKTGKEAVDALNFSDEEYIKIFDLQNAAAGPNEMITLRGSDMTSLTDKRLENISPNEKIEQMRNRLKAFKSNFHPEFRARFSNDQALLEVAEAKGNKLKEYVEEYRKNQEALGQYDHFKSDVLERLAKNEEPSEISYQLLQSAIEKDNFDWAKRDLLLAYNLKAISNNDLETAFQKYYQENIKNMDSSKPGYQLTHDYRKEALQKLYYNVLRKNFKENI